MAKLPTKPFKVGPANLQWVFINGDGSTNDMGDVPKQEYKSTAVLPLAQAQPYIDDLDAFWLSYNGGKVVKAKSLGYKYQENEAGEKTGFVTFTFKTNTAFTQKNGTVKPTVVKVFRGNGAEITDAFHSMEKKASNDSEGIVHGTMAIYDRNAAARGITLYLAAVQFTKFDEYAGTVDVEAQETDEDDGLGGGGEDGLDVAPVQPEV
ncbi:MAG: hypothetical protein DRN33_06325 [Thermoplasmata archaeon]|nr:MAG: hypothetical protein DRN33_06325 [Thermoplasmata archaeon]